MKKFILLYVVLLFFYSLAMMIFILIGSHGRIILNNNETLKYLIIAGTFSILAIVLIATRKVGLKKWILTILIPLDLLTIAALWYQIIVLLPDTFTPLSIFILCLQAIGLMLGVFFAYKFISLLFYRKQLNDYRL